MDLLDYYRDNLSYLRRLSGEFAADFPKIARRLLLSEIDCQDPYIERLLEGTAFLAARVEKKLDEGYYPFLEAVLNSVAPDSLYPIPSGAVLEVMPNAMDEQAAKKAVIEVGTIFDANIPTINTPCRFSCAATVPVVPFIFSEAEYINRDVASIGIKNPQAESALRLHFSAASVLTKDMWIYLALSEADSSLLMRLMAQELVGVYAGSGGKFLPVEGVRCVISTPGAEIPYSQNVKPGVRGLRILRNYLNYPDFSKFISIQGLGAGLAGSATDELVFAFKRREQSLTAVVKASSVRVNCIPVLNLFSHRSNRISLEEDTAAAPYEFHIVPNRTAMRDYEVVAVKKIDFYNERNELIMQALNFYDGDISADHKNPVFFSMKRRRKLVERRSIARSSYDGTEVFVSFSPLSESRHDAWQFAADLLVTNRDLPLLITGAVPLSSPSSVASRAAFVTLPTRPGYPLAERGDQEDFARLSHVVMNLSAMLCQEGARPLELLRNILRAYPLRPPEEMERIMAGISALSGTSDTFRFVRNGVVFYEWGWRLKLVFDEDVFAGMGFYIFARVLAELLLSLTPLNTIVELEFSTLQSGVIAVWKTPEDR